VPEGDTVHKLAAAFRPLLVGERIASLWIRRIGDLPALAGQPIEEVSALGKHFLFAIGARDVLHVHLGLNGSWHRYKAGEPWQRDRDAATVRLVVGPPGESCWEHVCFRAKVAEVLPRAELRRHPVLSRLGPDLLAEEVDWDEIVERARRRAPATASDLLFDQFVACGIGNAFKNEVLFLAGLHPWTPAADLPADRVIALFRSARELLGRNLGGWPRTTTRPVRPGEPWPAHEPRYFVFERTGEPCLRCGTPVELLRQGDFASLTYWCPRCQPEGRLPAREAAAPSGP
jgi:endonuclease-8